MRKALRVSFILLFVAAVCLVVYISCGKDKATTPPGPSTEWTILVYSDGNNNLDNSQGGGSYCIQDIQDLQTVGSTDKVQIVAMISSMRTGGIAKYYHIEHYPDDLGDNMSSTVLVNKGTKDMSDWHTLKEFLVYGLENYPASKYMLIVDDHGAGWPGSCSDEQNGSGNIMSMFDMATAIEQAASEKSVAKFEIVTFHACLMSMVEVAYELRNCANWMVASEFSMPMESVLGADIWLANLAAHPTLGGRELAANIVDAVYQTGVAKQKIVHMSATDLSKIGRLASRMDNFGTQLVTSAGDNWGEVLDAWLHTNTTDLDHPAYVDVRELANKIKQEPNLQNINLIRDACDSVINALNDAVIMTSTNAPGIARGGLTIHMPYLREYYDSTNYARIDFRAVPWTNFLSRFIGIIEQIISVNLTVGVNPAGSGTVAVNPDQQSYRQGDVVTLTAAPNTGYDFANWTIQGTPVDGNPIQLTFGSNDVEAVANFTQQGGQNVTLNGSITWQGHTLTHPLLALIDQQGNFLKYWQLTGGTETVPFSVTFTLAEAPLSFIYAFDDIDNDQTVQEPGEPWNCFDSNGDMYCDWITYTAGQTINNVNIIVYAGGMDKQGEGPTVISAVK